MASLDIIWSSFDLHLILVFYGRTCVQPTGFSFLGGFVSFWVFFVCSEKLYSFGFESSFSFAFFFFPY